MYRDYLAKCYRTTVHLNMPYHFMWVTWHPFSVTSWSKLCTADEIRSAVTAHKDDYCGPDAVDDDVCVALAERLWLIVLSERQETLSMSDLMFGNVKKAMAMEPSS